MPSRCYRNRMKEVANRGGPQSGFWQHSTRSSVSGRRRIVEVVHVVVVDVNFLRQPGQQPGTAGHYFEFLDGHFVKREFVRLFHLSLQFWGETIPAWLKAHNVADTEPLCRTSHRHDASKGTKI